MKFFSIRKFIIFVIVIFAVLVLCFVSVYLVLLYYSKGKPLVENIISDVYEVIADGYIICTLGNNIWSDYFANLSETDKRFSHLGIIRIQNDEITVIHSAGSIKLGTDIVKEVSFETYISDVRAIGIYKTKDVDSRTISENSLKYIGVPFDWHFNMLDDSKIYCAELLYVILKEIKPSINLKTVYVDDVKNYILPIECVSDSEYFEEIFTVKVDLEKATK